MCDCLVQPCFLFVTMNIHFRQVLCYQSFACRYNIFTIHVPGKYTYCTIKCHQKSYNAEKEIQVVSPLNEFQSTGCFFLILEVKHIVDCKYSSKSRQKGRCDAFRYDTTLKRDHPAPNSDLPCSTLNFK